MMLKALQNSAHLEWPRLINGTLLRRYKRFMADVKLRNGHMVTAHCPNSGSMEGCSEAGRTVYLSRSSNPKRRLMYTWEMIKMPSSLVGVNTNIPNRLVREAILRGAVPALSGYDKVVSEIPYGRNSRIDILLEKSNGDRCYVEVKNCTLVKKGTAYFPDAVTTRGLKHLKDLQDMVKLGSRAVAFFLVQRMDADAFAPADHIDAAYGSELRKALRNGVQTLIYDVVIDLKRITLNRELPLQM